MLVHVVMMMVRNLMADVISAVFAVKAVADVV